MDFRVWVERMEFYLMANGLYSGLLDDEDPGDKKTLVQRQLACYGVINMNLSDSCRDAIRRLNTKDPRKCWEALIAEYDQHNPMSQMLLLHSLLELKCSGTVLDYVSEFNLIVAKLQSMAINFDQRLLVALMLRGLPSTFEVFRSTIRHREKVPTLDELCAMVKVEDKALARQQRTQDSQVYSAGRVSVSAAVRCTGCNRIGHSEDRCWTLHPGLAPTCRRCGRVGHLAASCTATRPTAPETDMARTLVDVEDSDQFDGFPPISL
jgi:hypothetical protein